MEYKDQLKEWIKKTLTKRIDKKEVSAWSISSVKFKQQNNLK